MIESTSKKENEREYEPKASYLRNPFLKQKHIDMITEWNKNRI